LEPPYDVVVAVRVLTRRALRGGLLCVLLGSACDHYRHELRPGTLAEVRATSLYLYEFESRWSLGIDNEGKDGACLQFSGLHVFVDGVAQTSIFGGGRYSGKNKFEVGPVDRTDSCHGAQVGVVIPDDPTRKSDVIDVTDGTRALHAEVPNVLATSTWLQPPPSIVRPGETFTVRIVPPVAVGKGQYDAGNLLAASIYERPPSTKNAKLAARLATSDTIELTVPASAPEMAAGHLILVSTQDDVPALACTAESCSTSSKVVLEATIDLAATVTKAGDGGTK
jgi:hypothetical protein